MGLVGRLVSQINVNLDGDILHRIFKERPHQMSDMSPSNIKSCNLRQGHWGAVGSVVVFNYTEDGKEQVSKELIEAIDDEKRSVTTVTYKVIEGDAMKLYRTFRTTVQVDSNGDNSVVTWTFDYEKLNVDVPDPQAIMDLCLQMTKDIETHCLTNLVTN